MLAIGTGRVYKYIIALFFVAERNNEKVIKIPEKSEKLAEFVGILLGDGCITSYKQKIGKKCKCYHGFRIAGHSENGHVYLTSYIKKLVIDLFGIEPYFYRAKNSKCSYICLQSVRAVNFLKSVGLKAGNKKKNNVGIPNWIFSDKKFMIACLRGLIDTDGTVYMCGNGSTFPRLGFCSKIKRLKEDFTRLVTELDYRPTPWMGKNLMIYRKRDIFKYHGEVGFSNPYHLERFERMCKAPLV